MITWQDSEKSVHRVHVRGCTHVLSSLMLLYRSQQPGTCKGHRVQYVYCSGGNVLYNVLQPRTYYCTEVSINAGTFIGQRVQYY